MTEPDVLVVGAGLAGLSAALAAREQGASVLVLERAPREERGGNSRFSIGAMRAVYAGVEDIEKLVGDLGAAERARVDFGAYTRQQYLDDLARVTQQRGDRSSPSCWSTAAPTPCAGCAGNGVRFRPLTQWQFKQADGRVKFAGGSAVGVEGAGAGLADALFTAAEQRGVTIAYGTRAVALIESGQGGVAGVRVRQVPRSTEIAAKAVVLACRGIRGQCRVAHALSRPGWELAKVRGSRFNTGDGLRMALEIGAMPCGNWSGCHSASWDLGAPDVERARRSAPSSSATTSSTASWSTPAASASSTKAPTSARSPMPRWGVRSWRSRGRSHGRSSTARRRICCTTSIGRRASARYGQTRSPSWQASFTASTATLFSHRRQLQSRGADATCRSIRAARTDAARGPCGAEVELGRHHRRAAVRSLSGDLRHHLHIRGRANRPQRAGDRRRRRRPCRGCSPPASWSAACSISTIRAARA